MIKEEIKLVLGDEITFFNGAPNLAKYLRKVLEENNLKESQEGKVEFIDSKKSESKKERFYKILKEENYNEEN